MLQRIVLAALLLGGGTAAAQTAFPANADWKPLTKGATCDPVTDAAGDSSSGQGTGDRDFFGTATPLAPAAQWFSDGVYLWVRLRVDTNPAGNGDDPWANNAGWGCQLDTDADATTWETMFLLDGKNNAIQVSSPVVHFTMPNDQATWSSSPIALTTTNNRSVLIPAAPPEKPDVDYFIDYAVPLSALGLTCSSNVHMTCGSNSNAQATLTTGSSGDIIGIGNVAVPPWSQTASCAFDIGCATGATCGADHTCGVGCTTDYQPPDAGPAADAGAGECTPPTPFCVGGVCNECRVAQGNADCANPTPICTNGTCVGCTLDTQCAQGQICSNGSCLNCLPGTNQGCDPTSTKPICQANDMGNTCVACTSTDQCPATRFCATTGTLAGACVQCLNNTQCPTATDTDPICGSLDTCVLCDDTTVPDGDAACTSDSGGTLPYCQKTVPGPTLHQCVQCLLDTQCTTGHCLDATFTCVGCEADTDCPIATPCDDTSHQCAPCSLTNPCSDGLICDNGQCVACGDSSDCTAPQLPICSLAMNMCVACTSDTDCRAKDPNFPACVTNVADTTHVGSCQECTPPATGQTGNNQICAAAGEVCSTDTYVCVQCNVSGDCPGGATCNPTTHTCGAPPPDAGVPDAAPPTPDAALPPDAAPPPPDARLPDARLPDAAAPVADARPADARATDARPTDARQADGGAVPSTSGYIEGGGCNCRVSGERHAPDGSAWLLLGFAAVLIALRRRAK